MTSKCVKISKLLYHLERLWRGTDDFAGLIDGCRRRVPKKSGTLANVCDSVGFESHQPGASDIGSHRIIREHNLSQGTRGAVEGSVAFHGHNAVCDNEVDRNGGAQIEDALLNTLPVENI